MKLFYKNESGTYVDISVYNGSTNVFGNVNGFFGGETTANLKIQAEDGESLKNICVRIFETEVKSGGATLSQYMLRDEENKEFLKSILRNDIKIKFENKPYKNGLVFLTDILNSEESQEIKGTYPYKEFEFTLTVTVAEKTLTEILTSEVKTLSLEFIYN